MAAHAASETVGLAQDAGSGLGILGSTSMVPATPWSRVVDAPLLLPRQRPEEHRPTAERAKHTEPVADVGRRLVQISRVLQA